MQKNPSENELGLGPKENTRNTRFKTVKLTNFRMACDSEMNII